MRYHGEEALGLIETVGMVPALYGADLMLKAADVTLISYENVGSTLVTVMVKGDVGAVKAAVETGAPAAASIGKVTASNAMPRPVKGVGDIVSVHDVDAGQEDVSQSAPRALGLIETYGLVFVLEAADAMIKTSDVDLVGYANTASGYISVLVEGDTSACQAAVDAGVRAVEALGAQVYSSIAIPTPHPDLKKITQRYAVENLIPGNSPQPCPHCGLTPDEVPTPQVEE